MGRGHGDRQRREGGAWGADKEGEGPWGTERKRRGHQTHKEGKGHGTDKGKGPSDKQGKKGPWGGRGQRSCRDSQDCAYHIEHLAQMKHFKASTSF